MSAAATGTTGTTRPIRRVMVTGGSGFLGRNLIAYLAAKGVEVNAIARSDAARAVVEAAGATAFIGDLSNVATLREAMSGCDAVVHCAASVEQWGNLDRLRTVNVQGTVTVAECCKLAGVPRIIHVSTEAVLARGRPIIMADESMERVNATTGAGVYSISKAEAESTVLSMNSDELEVIVVRPRFIWGNDDTVVLASLTAAVREGALKWFGGGNYLTSTCHVTNVCEGLLLAAERGRPGEIYFVTDGQPQSFREFVSTMLETVEVQPPTASIPLWVAWCVAYGAEAFASLRGTTPIISRQVLSLVAFEVTVSDAKARKELGYEGRISIEEGMEDLRRRHQAKNG